MRLHQWKHAQEYAIIHTGLSGVGSCMGSWMGSWMGVLDGHRTLEDAVV